MASLDSILVGTFKRGKEGEWLFFPWGVAGRGFVLPGEEVFARLRRRVVAGLLALVVATFAAAWVAGPAAGCGVLGTGLVAYALWVRQLSGRLEASPERLHLAEVWSAQSEATSGRELWLWLAAVTVAILVAVAAYLRGGQPGLLVVALGFGMAGLWLACLVFRRRAR